ncbi:DNA repair protein RecN [Microlunatus panaciterrae]|uniref:DNA repair protein RecN n=1 Tax=Microlunatus panaciterrae TaxID=400768 RepID=A0ABS2RRA2_9ACTN|nr:DNA repair protein RecN [Microlunatus panaciterrae]MBM7800464.1 DNA repair protein RecN (Recombination protein N) [Microlunatus panaciterrae]
MISELRIADLGVIDDAILTLDPGLTVVTGETGAGKTMIVSGIGLLLGERADPRSVRSGAERARVEGLFMLTDPVLQGRIEDAGGQVEDGELLIARQITAAGRSRAWVGGAQVPAAVCADIASDLVTVYGQSEQIALGREERQRSILDRFVGAPLLSLLTEYRQLYVERRALVAELEQLRSDAQTRAREVDLIQFGLDEIERVAPQPGEDVALAAEAHRLQSMDDLRNAAQLAMMALAGDDSDASGATALGALGSLAVARKAVEEAAEQDVQAGELATRSAELGYLLADLTSDVARYLETLEAEPGRLEQIAERRSVLATLTRKYGDSCDEVLEWARTSAQRMAGLESSDARIVELQDRVKLLDGQLNELAGRITDQRVKGAADLGEAVKSELSALAMPHARLLFDITRAAELGPHGADVIELLFSANPGSEPRSLAKVASGGELSRVRLALEVILAGDSVGGTFVFDEVDAGVGGKVAVEIGKRLATLARRAQVIVVTHLAQVAAFADRHFVVVKADDGQVTTSGVAEVQDADRAEELARMMAGLETTSHALAHAEELVQVAESHRRSTRSEKTPSMKQQTAQRLTTTTRA